MGEKSNLLERLLIKPNIWAAGGVLCLLLFAERWLNQPLSWPLHLLCFTSVLLIYNLDHLLDSAGLPGLTLKQFPQHPFIYSLTFMAGCLTLALLWLIPAHVRAVLTLPGLIGLLYGLPLLAGRQRWYRLKDIPGSKAWLVAGAITTVIIGLPLTNQSATFGLPTAQLTSFLLIFTASNTHMFDVRDVQTDQQHHVPTLPVLWGVRATQGLMVALNLMLLMGLWLSQDEISIVMLLATLATCAYLVFLKPETPAIGYALIIDGLLFLPLLLWLMGLR